MHRHPNQQQPSSTSLPQPDSLLMSLIYIKGYIIDTL